jgi:hypothetical protein
VGCSGSTKLAHFIPMKMTNSTEELVPLYIKEVLRLHGVPKSMFLSGF